MRRAAGLLLVLLLGMALGFLLSRAPGNRMPAAAQQARQVKYYKSTMIPGEIRQTPGKDSMGMEMVPVYEEEPTATIVIDPVTIQNMGVRTETVIRGPLVRTIRTVGFIEPSEPNQVEVTTKFRGWVEKLYVDAVGQYVRKGDPLLEIYAPELFSAASEYLMAKKSGNNVLLSSALKRLKYFDMPAGQIAELERSGRVPRALRLEVPADGYVLEKTVVSGQMVEAGQRLYRIADLSMVWVLAQIYEQDLPLVRAGQNAEVRLSYVPGRGFNGRVTYVYPTLDEKTRTARVRMEFPNPELMLRPGMFVGVELQAQLAADAVQVPDSAVLRSGERNTVFVALDGGRFDPRTVVLGASGGNNRYQVLNGVKPGERVVVSGQFLIDSESQLREAIQKMIPPGGAPPTASPEPGAHHHH